MSAVIKSGSAAGLATVRPLPSANAAAMRPGPTKEEEERDRLQRRVTALEEDLKQRDASIAKLHADVDAAFDSGKAQGHRLGLADAETRERDRLSLLEGAMGSAGAALAGSLSSLERLSALLARDVLEVILGDPDYRREQLEAVLATQMAKIEKAALVQIEVSNEDFPDKTALTAIAGRAGVESALIVSNAELSAGSCAMKLRLGRQEVGVNQQWNVLRAWLEDAAQPEAPT